LSAPLEEDARVPPQNAKNIVELRRMLAEKFPGVRMTAEAAPSLGTYWRSGLPQLDGALGGGIPKGGITELITPANASGTSLVVNGLLWRAHEQGQWLALVDGSDCFDPCAFDKTLFSRVLWVRCSTAKEAIKASDLLLHDGTIPFIVLDLANCPTLQLRRMNSSIWFRMERVIENTETALVVFTPQPMISHAQARLKLEARFSIDSLEQTREVLTAGMTFSALEARHRRTVKIA
jgi:hypothetical protein